MDPGAKVFIKIDDYKDVIDTMELIKEKVDDAKAVLEHLNELKNQEDAELDVWRSTLDSIKAKADYVDQSLFQEHI